jgi:predicted ATP-grasp superfamily ATP-dependent carboligase
VNDREGAVARQARAVLVGDLNMLRSFAGTGVPTTVVARKSQDLTFLSRHCAERATIPDPRVDEAGAVEGLIAVAAAGADRPVLFYGDDSMLLLLSRHRDRLNEFYRYRMPPASLIEACVDKCRFAELAARSGVPVPRGVRSAEQPTAEGIVREVGLPCVIKPNQGIEWFRSEAVRRAGGKPQKMLLASTREDLDRLLGDMATSSPQFMAQEYIPGGEDQIYSYHAYVDGSGRLAGEYVGRKVRTYPSVGGVSTYVGLIDAPAVRDLGRDVLQRLGVTGVVKIDFKRDVRRDRYLVLELNLRFNLWNYLGTACGVNLPLTAYRDNCGLPLPPLPASWRTDVRWLSFGDDLRAMVRDYRPSGEVSWGTWLRSLSAPKVYEMFAWDDPLPFAVNLARYARLLAGRLTHSTH